MIAVVIDPLFGDSGKGQGVHNLAKQLEGTTLVVRFSGGPQSGHTVKHENFTHVFSNFGSGTFLSCPTYWTQHCVIDPAAAMWEYKDLKRLGCTPNVIYHPHCEVLVPYDRIEQITDKVNLKHGTVGTGYKACLDRTKAGYHLQVIDCMNLQVLRYKIAGIISHYYGHWTVEDNSVAIDIDQWCWDVFNYFKSEFVQIRTFDQILRDYRFADNPFANFIFEGSQGVLLDQTHGIMPFCTPSNTTCKNLEDVLYNEIDGYYYVQPYYVCRPYITRHGNGPIPSPNQPITVEDPHNPYNDFQGSFRAIPMDLDLLMHGIRVNEASYPYLRHGIIMVNHMDEYPDFRLDIPDMETQYWIYDKKIDVQ